MNNLISLRNNIIAKPANTKPNIIDNNGSIVLKSVIFEENGKEYIFHLYADSFRRIH